MPEVSPSMLSGSVFMLTWPVFMLPCLLLMLHGPGEAGGGGLLGFWPHLARPDLFYAIELDGPRSARPDLFNFLIFMLACMQFEAHPEEQNRRHFSAVLSAA